MDIKKYIESGILELYVLGKLSDAERQEVEANALQYPEIKAEIEATELALETYAMGQKTSPSPGSLDNIMNRIGFDSSSGSNSKTNWGWITGILFLLAAAWGISQMLQNQQLNTRSLNTQAELNQLQEECDEIQRQLNDTKLQLDIIRAQGNQPVIMKGNMATEEIIATVHWNKEAEKTYLDLNEWPTPPQGQQYQLWAIVNGTPTDMGPIDLSLTTDGFLEVPHYENAEAFAVSLEPEGGSPTPTTVLMIQFTS